MPRYKNCSFGSCVNNTKKFNLKFYSFRRHDASIWKSKCENSALNHVSTTNLLKNFVVCGKHFKSTDFTRCLSPFKNKLTKEAVPHNYRIETGKLLNKLASCT